MAINVAYVVVLGFDGIRKSKAVAMVNLHTTDSLSNFKSINICYSFFMYISKKYLLFLVVFLFLPGS